MLLEGRTGESGRFGDRLPAKASGSVKLIFWRTNAGAAYDVQSSWDETSVFMVLAVVVDHCPEQILPDIGQLKQKDITSGSANAPSNHLDEVL